jgi:LPXTG-site transpeptidase (sortase) family protein
MHPKAHYDANGNIILPALEGAEEHVQPKIEGRPRRTDTIKLHWKEIRSRIAALGTHVTLEGGQQWKSSREDSEKALMRACGACRTSAKALWAFLLQPVWVPGRKSIPKRYTRGTLFLVDTLRFGTTFAAIFGVLFLTLNYQSFLSIMTANINPLAGVLQASKVQNALDDTLREKLQRSPALAVAGNDIGMLELLPPVGPPDNRLIIPSLNLNVPIVIPPVDALLNEEWGTLEGDIQQALVKGVVHYPGTARPGQAGNFFITGHSSYYPWAEGQYKSVFARLHTLHVGDEYWVFYGGDRHRYRILDIKEVRPSDVSVLDQPLDKRLSTLMTCTPVGTTLRRLIVTAAEIDPISAEPLAVGEHEHRPEHPKVKVEMLPI